MADTHDRTLNGSSTPSPMDIARLAPGDTPRALNTAPTGLSPEEARRRLVRYGPNSLQEVRGPSLVLRFLRQFTHFLALLLWVA
ncbi:MAG: hypothetical protein KGJ14_10030, partial [Nitrospirota bacterium]|nr:hypothetical protein [Nitrospirota bacterium]